MEVDLIALGLAAIKTGHPGRIAENLVYFLLSAWLLKTNTKAAGAAIMVRISSFEAKLVDIGTKMETGFDKMAERITMVEQSHSKRLEAIETIIKPKEGS